MRRERSVFSVVLGIFLACVSVLAVGALCLLPALRGTDRRTPEGIPIPALVGTLYRADAIPAGLGAHLHYQTDTTLPEGTVLAQAPPAGVSARTGSVLDLTISTHHTAVRLPDLLGQDAEAAAATLAALGLHCTLVDQVHEDLPNGRILATYPCAGEAVFPQEQITLVRASATTIPVPDVVGLSLDEAIFKLKSAGLAIGSISRIPHAVASGTVLSQSITGRAQPGAAVALVAAE